MGGVNKMKCFGCKSKMYKKEIIVPTSWGDGRKVDVLVMGWQCEFCDHQVFDHWAVRIIQDEAAKASRKT